MWMWLEYIRSLERNLAGSSRPTWAGARKLIDLHLHNAFDANRKPTGVKSAVIAPTYQLANDFDIPELTSMGRVGQQLALDDRR